VVAYLQTTIVPAKHPNGDYQYKQLPYTHDGPVYKHSLDEEKPSPELDWPAQSQYQTVPWRAEKAIVPQLVRFDGYDGHVLHSPT
jgi:hypothetical protein